MPKTLVPRSALERESRQGCAPRQRPIALVELIITAALALSTAVAATAVSIGMALCERTSTKRMRCAGVELSTNTATLAPSGAHDSSRETVLLLKIMVAGPPAEDMT